MNTTLLWIRRRQIIYELKQLGIYSIVILIVCLTLIYYSFFLYSDLLYAVLLTISIGLSVLAFHSSRADISFLYLHSSNFHASLFLEYFVFTFPFIVMCLFTSQWYCFPILTIFLYLIPYSKLKIKQKSLFRNISKIISPEYFEWISGFRKTFIQVIPVYLLALGFSWIKILPLFLLWYLTIVISSYYNESESIQILREGNHSSVSFLKKKILSHSVLLTGFYLPVLVINAFFNFNLILLITGFWLSQMVFLTFIICFKYSNYIPNRTQYGNNLIVIIVSLSSAIPVLLPVSLIVTFKYISNANLNLKEFLDD